MKINSALSVADVLAGPAEAFAPLAERFGSVWLDSSLQSGEMGTQSFVTSQPVTDISQTNGRVSIAGHKPATGNAGADSILEIVQMLCQQEGLTAIGYITFEATLPWLGLNCPENSLLIPEARFLLYDSIQRFGHDSMEHCAKLNDKSTRAWRLSQKPLSCERQASVPADSVGKHGKTGRGGTLPITNQSSHNGMEHCKTGANGLTGMEGMSRKPSPCERQASVPADSVGKHGKTGRGGTLPITNQSARENGESNGAWDEPPGLPAATVRSSLSKEDYLARVRMIKQHIKEGDIYQANFTTRFEVSGAAEPFRVYQRLRRYNPAPYAAYLNFGDYQILSSSPERMFLRQNDIITTCPIKGTIRRGSNDREDSRKLKTLVESEKDRAELLMIVDLERNDMGKLARPGTVRVDDLFEPLQYSSVFHLAANISATLRPNISMSDIIKALLPGGSISGAPKRRAVEIIRQLETVPRSVYTGCIGYIDGQTADFSIGIRTMLHRNGRYHVHAGGGIVADSDPEEEYREMFLKARNLFRALGADPAKVAQ